MPDFVYLTHCSCSVCGWTMFLDGSPGLHLWSKTLRCINPKCTRRDTHYAVPKINVERVQHEEEAKA